MFEESFIRALIRKVESIVRKHPSDSVSMVRVQVGPLAETDPRILEATFERLAESPTLRDSQLSVEKVPLVLRCESCRAILERDTPGFGCPACGSDRTVIVSGDALALESVTLVKRRRFAAPRSRGAELCLGRAVATGQESEANLEAVA